MARASRESERVTPGGAPRAAPSSSMAERVRFRAGVAGAGDGPAWREGPPLDEVFEALDLAVVVFDATGHPARANAAARALFGVDPARLGAAAFVEHVTRSLGMRTREGRRVRRDDLAMHGDAEERLFEVTDPAGRVRTLSATARPLHERGRSSGAVVAWRDVTERTEAQELARRAERSKDEFLAMLGHELRNPLAPILTAVQLLASREGDEASRELAVIERQARHMTRLVDDLLDVARITRGKLELERRPLELRAVLVRAVDLADPLLEHGAHPLDLAVPDGISVEGDEDRLAQVFANLLTNAARYSPAGTRIAVRAEVAGAAVRVTVADQGIGIAPELLPRLFQLFVQGDRPLDRAEGGLGLGLALVRTLTLAHGGRVEARSAGPGRGSEFVVELPLRAAGAMRAAAAPAQAPAPAPAPRSESRRVLVVDDNRDAAELLAEGLRLHGHEVEVAFDGPGALEVAAALDPEVALVDIGLPVMSGYELAPLLRARSTGCHLVAVTGYGQEADRARAREHGFDAHVVKPVDLTAIRELVRRAGRS